MIAIQKHLVKIAVLLNIYGPYEYESGVQLCLKMSPQIRGLDHSYSFHPSLMRTPMHTELVRVYDAHSDP